MSKKILVLVEEIKKIYKYEYEEIYSNYLEDNYRKALLHAGSGYEKWEFTHESKDKSMTYARNILHDKHSEEFSKLFERVNEELHPIIFDELEKEELEENELLNFLEIINNMEN